MCEKEIELAIKINQAEQELTIASNNYRNTGLARYKQTVMDFEFGYCEVVIQSLRKVAIVLSAQGRNTGY